jgi:hypothetical protein
MPQVALSPPRARWDAPVSEHGRSAGFPSPEIGGLARRWRLAGHGPIVAQPAAGRRARQTAVSQSCGRGCGLAITDCVAGTTRGADGPTGSATKGADGPTKSATRSGPAAVAASATEGWQAMPHSVPARPLTAPSPWRGLPSPALGPPARRIGPVHQAPPLPVVGTAYRSHQFVELELLLFREFDGHAAVARFRLHAAANREIIDTCTP